MRDGSVYLPLGCKLFARLNHTVGHVDLSREPSGRAVPVEGRRVQRHGLLNHAIVPCKRVQAVQKSRIMTRPLQLAPQIAPRVVSPH
jgi:hypothetical protein